VQVAWLEFWIFGYRRPDLLAMMGYGQILSGYTFSGGSLFGVCAGTAMLAGHWQGFKSTVVHWHAATE